MNIKRDVYQIFSAEGNLILESVIAKPVLIYGGYSPKYKHPVEQKQTKGHQIHIILKDRGNGLHLQAYAINIWFIDFPLKSSATFFLIFMGFQSLQLKGRHIKRQDWIMIWHRPCIPMYLTALTQAHTAPTVTAFNIMRMLLFDTVILYKSRTYRCRDFILTLRASITRSLASSSPSMMLRRVRSSGLLRLSMFSSHF